MQDSKIEQVVSRALSELQNEFRVTPGLFYTEFDLTSRAYHLIQKGLAYQRVRGHDGEEHYLVHCEYPTPFRCNMDGTHFEVADDDARSPRSSKYRRGHYDLAVLNPEFLRCAGFELANGQNYRLLKSELPRILTEIGEPPVLAGIEFMYKRRLFRSKSHIHRWYQRVRQDLMKLEASRIWQGMSFMQTLALIAFNRDTRQHVQSEIASLFRRHPNLILCTCEESPPP